MPTHLEAVTELIKHLESQGRSEGPLLRGLRLQRDRLLETAADRLDRQRFLLGILPPHGPAGEPGDDDATG